MIEIIYCAGRDYDDYVDSQHEMGMSAYEDFDEWLADELLANGVIVPPCKVGDKVYCIVKYQSKGFEDRLPERDIIIEEKITRIAQTKMPYLFFDTNTVHFTEDKIGKTVFLTKEEAEEKLKELNGNGQTRPL